jgi:hypothetical protein
MKVLVFINFLFVVVLTAPKAQYDECGALSSKTNCCPGLEKLIEKDCYENCLRTCIKEKEENLCCYENCQAHKLGIVKDGKADKETSLASLTSKVENDQEWTAVSSNQYTRSSLYESK